MTSVAAMYVHIAYSYAALRESLHETYICPAVSKFLSARVCLSRRFYWLEMLALGRPGQVATCFG